MLGLALVAATDGTPNCDSQSSTKSSKNRTDSLRCVSRTQESAFFFIPLRFGEGQGGECGSARPLLHLVAAGKNSIEETGRTGTFLLPLF